MGIKELAQELESVEFKAEIIWRTALAVHDAMNESSSTAESYIVALYGVMDSMFNLDKELKKLVDGAFELLKESKLNEG